MKKNILRSFGLLCLLSAGDSWAGPNRIPQVPMHCVCMPAPNTCAINQNDRQDFGEEHISIEESGIHNDEDSHGHVVEDDGDANPTSEDSGDDDDALMEEHVTITESHKYDEDGHPIQTSRASSAQDAASTSYTSSTSSSSSSHKASSDKNDGYTWSIYNKPTYTQSDDDDHDDDAASTAASSSSSTYSSYSSPSYSTPVYDGDAASTSADEPDEDDSDDESSSSRSHSSHKTTHVVKSVKTVPSLVEKTQMKKDAAAASSGSRSREFSRRVEIRRKIPVSASGYSSRYTY